nr:YqaJ viral recombinase family protein [Micromonospora sp. DSM 115978]
MTASTAARRVTPTAVRLLPADADRDAWLAARRGGIGSSDVAAILGVADKRTPLHVWHDKRGDLVDDAGEAALWGTLLEEPIAREWARRNRSVVQRVGLIAHAETPWMLATLDRRVAECPMNRETRQACALEVKCRNAYTAPNRWRGDVPDDVLAQTTWQLAVTGYDHIHVAVLIGGNDYRQTVVRRDDAVMSYVVGDVAGWRERHLLGGEPPAWDLNKAAALIELDALMHPDRAGEVGLDGIGEVIEYARLSAKHGAVGRAKERQKAILARLADGAQTVTFGGELAYQYTPRTRATADLARLAERWPDAYADVVTEKTYFAIQIARDLKQTGEVDE